VYVCLLGSTRRPAYDRLGLQNVMFVCPCTAPATRPAITNCLVMLQSKCVTCLLAIQHACTHHAMLCCGDCLIHVVCSLASNSLRGTGSTLSPDLRWGTRLQGEQGQHRRCSTSALMLCCFALETDASKLCQLRLLQFARMASFVQTDATAQLQFCGAKRDLPLLHWVSG
jgi:hypothetical protein